MNWHQYWDGNQQSSQRFGAAIDEEEEEVDDGEDLDDDEVEDDDVEEDEDDENDEDVEDDEDGEYENNGTDLAEEEDVRLSTTDGQQQSPRHEGEPPLHRSSASTRRDPHPHPLRASSAVAKRSENRVVRLARWTVRAWNGTKSWFLGPLFIGMALGAGIAMGRSLFFLTLHRTTRLLLGPHAAARFNAPHPWPHH